MSKRKKALLACVTDIAVLLALIAILDRRSRQRVIIDFRGPPGVVVKGFYEVDGTRHELTEVPFRLDARVHRVLYQYEPIGGEHNWVYGEIYYPQSGGQAAFHSSSPGYAIRGWLRNDAFGPGELWFESYDPANDRGWQKPPPWLSAE